MLSGAPEILERYFDYEAFGRDLFLESYIEINGFVFAD
jgi:antirestriction protein